MIRDIYHIIMQPVRGEKGELLDLDGGDSAFSTGLMAFGGSKEDQDLMNQFVTKMQLVRHPFDFKNTGTAPHNNPKSVSRDQVVAFFSGIYGRPVPNLLKQVCLSYAEKWFVNSDFLSPAVRYYLYKCAGVKPPFWLKPLAEAQQWADLLANCYVNPDHEMNQAIVINTVFGKSWLRFLVNHHPNLEKNVFFYFNGWRERTEIAQKILARVWQETK